MRSMKTDIKEIAIFGLSFSKGFDQVWFNLWLKDDGYSMDFYQFTDDDDEPLESATMISSEQGEELLLRMFENGRVEDWKDAYTAADEGVDTDLNWTLDVDGPNESDLIFSSGNGKLPPRAMTMGVIDAIRKYEPSFALCFDELK